MSPNTLSAEMLLSSAYIAPFWISTVQANAEAGKEPQTHVLPFAAASQNARIIAPGRVSDWSG